MDRMQSADAEFWHPDTESQSNRTHVQTITHSLGPKKTFTSYKYACAIDNPDICERENNMAIILLYGDERYSIWLLMFLQLLKQYGQMLTKWLNLKLCSFSVTNANKYLVLTHAGYQHSNPPSRSLNHQRLAKKDLCKTHLNHQSSLSRCELMNELANSFFNG